jgi:hypothetical protein
MGGGHNWRMLSLGVDEWNGQVIPPVRLGLERMLLDVQLMQNALDLRRTSLVEHERPSYHMAVTNRPDLSFHIENVLSTSGLLPIVL